MTDPLSNPGVRFPPPTIFVAGFFAGWLLDRRVRALPLSELLGGAGEIVGVVLVAIGLGLTLWGLATFHAARTAIMPNQAASRIVTSGPYRFTRNPMYTGLTIGYIGGAGVIDTAWPLVLLPLVLALLVELVISREERYLSEAFGDAYDEYKSRVGRWW
jgi:protein-S-isoprenylcysteine O-methyltransferase Ste14